MTGAQNAEWPSDEETGTCLSPPVAAHDRPQLAVDDATKRGGTKCIEIPPRGVWIPARASTGPPPCPASTMASAQCDSAAAAPWSLLTADSGGSRRRWTWCPPALAPVLSKRADSKPRGHWGGQE